MPGWPTAHLENIRPHDEHSKKEPVIAKYFN